MFLMSHDHILDKHTIVDMFLMSHDQILEKHTIVDMFLMMSHDQIIDKHTIVDMFLITSTIVCLSRIWSCDIIKNINYSMFIKDLVM
jgi:hypothetical protein